MCRSRLSVLLLVLVSLSLASFGTVGLVPLDACCQSVPVADTDDCCDTSCDHCVACSPSAALVVSQMPIFGCLEPLHCLGTAVASDPLTPEPRGILHVPRFV
ncbi:MAG: hypothetical protein ACKVU1_07820 [bacterium]